jgi:hypothetical protein
LSHKPEIKKASSKNLKEVHLYVFLRLMETHEFFLQVETHEFNSSKEKRRKIPAVTGTRKLSTLRKRTVAISLRFFLLSPVSVEFHKSFMSI